MLEQLKQSFGDTALGPDEDADIQLVRGLLFQSGKVELRPFSHDEKMRGKTPDFRIFRNQNLSGLIEIKSPRDDWLDEQFEQAMKLPTDRRTELVGGLRSDPVFNRLGRLLKKAAQQLAAVEIGAHVPRLVVIVNHDDMTRPVDVDVTIKGEEISEDGSVISTQEGAAEGVRHAILPVVDLIVFIDAKSRRVRRLFRNEERPKLADGALDLLDPIDGLNRPPV